MSLICVMVKQILETSYLSVEAEGKLRQVLQTSHYDREDFDALVTLQLAAMTGRVTQESRELLERDLLLHQ